MRLILAAAVMTLGQAAAAHEMSPTYPVLRNAYLDGVKTTQMTLINKREDIDFYSISVFDDDWEPINFITDYGGTIEIGYMQKKIFNLYLRNSDAKRAEYICSTSRSIKLDPRATSVKSRICSRVSN
jgi:hypothetical protein